MKEVDHLFYEAHCINNVRCICLVYNAGEHGKCFHNLDYKGLGKPDKR